MTWHRGTQAAKAYRTWKKVYGCVQKGHYRHVRYKTTFKPFWTANNKIRSMSHSLHHATAVQSSTCQVRNTKQCLQHIHSIDFSLFLLSATSGAAILPIPLRGQLWFCLPHVENTLPLSTRRCFAVREWAWHARLRATIKPPLPKEAQSKETTSQQKMKGCHRGVLSSRLGPVVLNENRPAWPGSTYLFLQMCNFGY